MRGLLSYLFDLILPPRRSEVLVRQLTAAELYSLGGDDPLPYHDPRVVALVWELKYYASARAATLCGGYISEFLLAAAAEEIGRPLLVPIPMHPARRRERGHNQTEVLCRAALPQLDDALEYAPRALHRVVNTPTQQGLPRTARLKNVHDSMQAEPHVVAGRACVVVDDVITTGATLEEAKRALLSAGARAVHCIALARS